MKPTNMPILWQNTVAGLGEDAAGLYLRGAARNEIKAFRMACKWDDLFAKALPPMIAKAGEIVADQGIFGDGDDTAGAVLRFLKERWFRLSFPDGRD